MDRLRGRGRIRDDSAPGPDLGATWPHARHPGPRQIPPQTSVAALCCYKPGGTARLIYPPSPSAPEGSTQELLLAGLPRPAGESPHPARRPHSGGLGQSQPDRRLPHRHRPGYRPHRPHPENLSSRRRTAARQQGVRRPELHRRSLGPTTFQWMYPAYNQALGTDLNRPAAARLRRRPENRAGFLGGGASERAPRTLEQLAPSWTCQPPISAGLTVSQLSPASTGTPAFFCSAARVTFSVSKASVYFCFRFTQMRSPPARTSV